MFSFIKTMRSDPSRVMPDRSFITMDMPFLRAYTQVGGGGTQETLAPLAGLLPMASASFSPGAAHSSTRALLGQHRRNHKRSTSCCCDRHVGLRSSAPLHVNSRPSTTHHPIFSKEC